MKSSTLLLAGVLASLSLAVPLERRQAETGSLGLGFVSSSATGSGASAGTASTGGVSASFRVSCALFAPLNSFFPLDDENRRSLREIPPPLIARMGTALLQLQEILTLVIAAAAEKGEVPPQPPRTARLEDQDLNQEEEEEEDLVPPQKVILQSSNSP